MKDYIWYASYGSNISEERFLCYIQGGKPEGATRTYLGCNDTTLPLDQKPIQIPHEMYFAKSASAWNGGGVCFINPDRDDKVKTFGNMYLITREQFLEVVQQENATDETIKIDFEKVRNQKSLMAKENSWYGNLLCLGEENRAPILNFTNKGFLLDELNPPNEHYLKTIMKGLIKSHQLSNSELEEYFESKKGIRKPMVRRVISSL
ncbi:hypothetical protein SAMN05661096_01235 [Marivirga sericea]|uniref:Histone deacetylase n=1 Tax=Marivirga sericea TaxID=1028 RepID=A0A1X7J2Y0_9BACT|nr:hypothetical protein [Marivirga sericea]SMG21829.1 hypothetical protein SAMN05661096_01235 [Marivirga sericea]